MKSLLNSLKLYKNKKQIKSNDTGRSMIEMLGVLAIIGVLSIDGIEGYKFTMTKYQANQVVNEVNCLRNDLEQQIIRGNNSVSLGDPYGEAGATSGYLRTNDYPVKYNCGEGIEGKLPLCKYEEVYYVGYKMYLLYMSANCSSH